MKKLLLALSILFSISSYAQVSEYKDQVHDSITSATVSRSVTPGIVGRAHERLADIVAEKLDSISYSGDTVYQWEEGERYFAFVIEAGTGEIAWSDTLARTILTKKVRDSILVLIGNINTSLALKENLANKSIDGTFASPNNDTYPSTLAVKQALDLKEPSISPGTTSQYRRGDETWQTLDKTAVGLPNVDNVSDANKPVSTAQQTAIDAKVLQTITNGVTTSAPSQDAVFDALALKANQQALVDSAAAIRGDFPEGGGSGSRYVTYIVTNGESNSGGQAPNADATAPELAVRSAVQILNNNSLTFESLDVGTNNNIGHFGLTSVTHGWEIGLANQVEAGRFMTSQVYLTKTGQGGATIEQLLKGHASGYWDSLTKRVDSAFKYFRANDKVPATYLWYSQGINNGPTGHAQYVPWVNKTITHITNFRARYGNVPVIISSFEAMTGREDLNASIRYVCSVLPGVYNVTTTGLTLEDVNHYDYDALKAMAASKVSYVVDSIGELESYPLWQSKTFVPYQKVIAPVSWTTLTETVITGEDLVTSTTNLPAGAVGSDAIDLTKPFEVVIEFTTSTDENAAVIAIDDENTDLAWSAGNTFLSGIYNFGGALNFATSSNTVPAGAPAFTVTYPTKVKLSKSGDDLAYSVSKDGGNTYSLLYIHQGALTGETVGYIKGIFAVGATGRKMNVFY
jgi:hypothetical protein